MSVSLPRLAGALILILLGIVSLVAAIFLAWPWPAYAAPAGFLVLAIIVLFVAPRRSADGTVGLHIDPGRLRTGQRRDVVMHALGYHGQLQALAETLPNSDLRQMLQQELPSVVAAVRLIHACCLAVQTYELGESANPEVDQEENVAAADEAIATTLEVLSQAYLQARGAWTAPEADPMQLATCFAALEPCKVRLREINHAFLATTTPSRDRP